MTTPSPLASFHKVTQLRATNPNNNNRTRIFPRSIHGRGDAVDRNTHTVYNKLIVDVIADSTNELMMLAELKEDQASLAKLKKEQAKLKASLAKLKKEQAKLATMPPTRSVEGAHDEEHHAHGHPLALHTFGRGWSCDLCAAGGDPNAERHRCPACDFDICAGCWGRRPSWQP